MTEAYNFWPFFILPFTRVALGISFHLAGESDCSVEKLQTIAT